VTALAHNSRDVRIGGIGALLAAVIRVARPGASAKLLRAFFFGIRH
jgi:hypothetical protein